MSLRSDKGTHDTRYRAVKRALAELSEAGAIQHLQTGWAGQRSVYRLTLDPGAKGGPTSPPVGGLRSPPKGGPAAQKRGVSETPPRRYEEYLSELDQERGGDLETASHPPRATGADVIQLFPDRPKRSIPTPLQDRLAAIIAEKEAK